MVTLQRGLGHSAGGGHCGDTRTSFTSWKKEIERKNLLGLSPKIMQSNHDFPLECSVSVNCHGWQANHGPLATAVVSLLVDFGNGPELVHRGDIRFAAIFGGYGLCGKILGVNYETIPNFKVESHVGHSDAEIAVSRPYAHTDMLNIHLNKDWTRAVTNEHHYVDRANPVVSKLEDKVSWWAPRLVRYTPRLRWFAQTNMNLHKITSRNELLYTSVRHFTWPNQELFECFVPTENAAEFVRRGRELIKRLYVYNTTVRDIQEDTVSILRYAKGPTRGFVVLCDKRKQNESVIGRLYELAIELGGSYYLPYNQYATVDQFRRAYPRWREFRQYQITESSWSRKYLGVMGA